MTFDYSFTAPYEYRVDSGKYDKHRSVQYMDFHHVPSLLECLEAMQREGVPYPSDVWHALVGGNSKPMVRVDARNYEEPYGQATVHFLVDTGADVSLLTASTADSLGIDRDPGTGGDPVMVTGIGGTAIAGLPRWIYVFLGGRLHPLPVLVPPSCDDITEHESLQVKNDILGRAGITNCFLLCFDNKRFYSFARRASEPPLS